MNKSKFLKKSLAMLLALMLVLAMIPLSASAAQTDHIDVLYVNGQNAALVGDDAYEVTVGTEKVSLNADVKDNVKLYYLDEKGNKQSIPAKGAGVTDVIDLLVNDYGTGTEDEYQMTIVAMVQENAAGSDTETPYEYTLTVKVDDSKDAVSTALAGLADTATWDDMTIYSVDNTTHVVTVNLKFGANAPATLSANDFNAVSEDATVVPAADGKSVTVTSPDGSETYEIKYVNEPAFESFTIPDQVGETEFVWNGQNNNEINVNVGYDYDWDNVIPAFALVDDLADYSLVPNGQAFEFVSGVTKIPSFTTAGTVKSYKFYMNVASYLEEASAVWATIDLNVTFVDENPEGVLKTVKVTDNETNHFSNVVEVTAPGTVNVEMPKDTVIDKDLTFTVDLAFSAGATVTLTDATGNHTVTAGTPVTGVKVGEGNSFTVKVQSEDGDTTNTYTINLNVANRVEAVLKNIILKDTVTGDSYEVKWDATGKNGTITVPYAWLATAKQSDVVVYMKSSTGATIWPQPFTSGNWWDYDFNGTMTLKEAIDSKWLPVLNSTSGITYEVTGIDSDVYGEYNVKIVTETAKGDRTISSLDFAGTNKEKEINASNTYTAELGKATLAGEEVNTIKVTVPYTWNTDVYLYNLKLADGAKMYAWDTAKRAWVAVSGVNEAGILTYNTGLTTTHLDAVDAKGVLNEDKAVKTIVLSEKEAVLAGDQFTTAKAYVDGENATYYYIYAEKAPAETGAELLSIESTVDKNVTATLEGTTITITVPYSYAEDGSKTFSLNFEASKMATVYSARSADGATYSDKVVSDEGEKSNFEDGTATKFDAGNKKFNVYGKYPAEKLYVVAEDKKIAKAYDVKLVIDKEQTGADITALSVNGTAATIAGDKINVRLPLGTKLYPVTLDITASKMADVQVGTTGGYDPEGRYDLNSALSIKVISEDGNTTKTYTLSAVVASNFEDVPTSEWYYDEVMTAANAGWINGTKPGYFEPNGTMTRGDFAVIIARILGCDTEATVESKFPDCNETDYFNAAVTFCKLRGIIDGDDKGYFNPYDAITREEMAKILCNALELDELETSANPFDDDAEIAQWAKGYVNAVQAEGIMEGSNGSFNPRDNATRAEGAAVLVRAFA